MTPNIWKYGERQKAGAMLVNWISDPRARDCKVSRSKLTAQDLESRGYTIRYTSKSLNSKYVEPLSQVGLPTEGEFYHHIDIEAPFATVGFVEPSLYDENVNGDPYFYNEYPGVRTWNHDTDEYQALLGTQIGKISASLVLGAFTRGTRRISRVVTWINDSLLYMRFDIELVR
ncbi:hypothetical protein N7513_006823 [Penicillium frequentans]|nr:hypothetical protein N7513_006823 [Penicillium glabrum]